MLATAAAVRVSRRRCILRSGPHHRRPPIRPPTPPPTPPATPNPGSGSSPGPTLTSPVNLSWSASSGATSYGVGVRDLASGNLVVDTNTSNTSYSASLPAGSYRWNVNACNSSGCSSFTTPLYFTIGTPPPPVPNTPANPNPGSGSSPGPTLTSPVNLS